jgi:hypothetical protein
VATTAAGAVQETIAQACVAASGAAGHAPPFAAQSSGVKIPVPFASVSHIVWLTPLQTRPVGSSRASGPPLLLPRVRGDGFARRCLELLPIRVRQ